MKLHAGARIGAVIAGMLVLAACGKSTAPGSEASTTAGGALASTGASETAGAASNASVNSGASAGGGSSADAAPMNAQGAGSARELTNPDSNTMVFLYYQLAHLPLPIETMVEDDSRVKFAPAPDKAAHRAAVRAEIESAAAAVRGVGAIRLTLNANLSEYDPSYGEFTVRALAPSSVVDFSALGQKVALNFTNGRTAQIWHVEQADAQAVRDKIGYSGNVEMDVLVRIANVLPGPGGGTISTEVVEYELRDKQRGVIIARVQVGKS
ncbi:MAG: hypothetical protein WDO56_12550 [Gammaproteobacteria bacterium]